MPPKKGGGTAVKKRNQSLDNLPRPSSMTHGAGHAGKNPLAAKSSQPKFNIAPPRSRGSQGQQTSTQ